ncbi:DUF6525 family protein [Rubrimonas cliftonensis]|uniref:Uncharacterized protein n=1 Tax=Rubrimonas cliftonensis TaxID=89524 RepID=A0A1H4GEZ4_9RHOB|nr:DUF6525 family protein [Rubrimonas cliftonensis]SEB08185.1 hypothetical protein SAMN05444370_1622 [Rubrimonas cliftonensis]
MRRNLATRLRRRASRNPMRDYDRAPPPLRAWLADAILPWSPKSALRVYERALGRSGGDIAAALTELDRRETALVARDPLWRDACASVMPSGQDAAKAGRL